MTHYLFTSESVSVGHPDKIADQISDAILDACLSQDKDSRVACEALIGLGLVVLAGEVTTKAIVDFQAIARETIKEIGYDDPSLGFDYKSCAVLTSIHRQSQDIAIGVDKTSSKELGAGDQGIMFGYACDETPELMPMPIMLAHAIVRKLKSLRESSELNYLKPDAKSQVTIEYDNTHRPKRLHSVVISSQHSPDVKQETLHRDLRKMTEEITPLGFIDSNTQFFINPTGRFVIGGPVGDTGLTGRKIIVDTYGGMGRHGGGAFSGKDPTKVDRSASYAARYVAKHIIAAKLAKRCEVQLSYAIGISHPISIKVDTFGTGVVDENLIAEAIPLVFNLSPQGIIDMLDLKRPIYKKTAFGGHFGRLEKEFSWEQVDKIENLKEAIKHRSFTH